MISIKFRVAILLGDALEAVIWDFTKTTPTVLLFHFFFLFVCFYLNSFIAILVVSFLKLVVITWVLMTLFCIL